MILRVGFQKVIWIIRKLVLSPLKVVKKISTQKGNARKKNEIIIVAWNINKEKGET